MGGRRAWSCESFGLRYFVNRFGMNHSSTMDLALQAASCDFHFTLELEPELPFREEGLSPAVAASRHRDSLLASLYLGR